MIRFRAVRLDVESVSGVAGYQAVFDGSRLAVIRGNNSVGKTLLVQSLVYGLGLEGMFGPGHHHGLLTRAMSTAVDLDSGTADVIRSAVTVELQNADGEIVTIHRDVRRPEVDDELVHLVMVTPGAALTDEAGGSPQAYYVRRQGAAQNERGFHRFLAEYLSWDLPNVSRYENPDSSLYIELLAPLFIVEQKAGWAGVLPRIPSYLRVRDPLARGIEFILGLTDGAESRASDASNARVRELEGLFAQRRDAILSITRLHGLDVLGLPERGASGRGEGVALIEADVRALVDGQWVALDRAIGLLELLSSEEVLEEDDDGAESDSTQEEAELARLTTELADVATSLTALEETASMVSAQLGALHSRIQHVDQERRRYQELKTLVGLGSPVIAATIARNDCPTCRQSLLGIEHVEGEALDYEASIRLLGQQLDTLRSLEEQAQRSSDTHDAARSALDQRAQDLRGRIKALRSDLVRPAGVPSLSRLQERLTAESRAATLRSLRDQVVIAMDELNAIAADLDTALRDRRDVLRRQAERPVRPLIDEWQQEFRGLLREFGFSTLSVDEISLDDSGKPSHAGYDLAFQGSASDGIRLRWAYHLSLMSVSLRNDGNHPGFLILDEPRQQEVDTVDFERFLRRLARLPDGQALVATSEPSQELRSWLGSESAQILPVDGALLRRM